MSKAAPERGDPSSVPGTPPGIIIPSIIFPAPCVNLYHWSVIACDQYTASLPYWQETSRIVAEHPSTRHLILPEYYLEHPDEIPLEQRIASINQTMEHYLVSGLLRTLDPGCMLLDRTTPDHGRRLGLLLAIDLECYDYTPGNRQLIRATEGTVVSRIPPRAAIRRHALLELPHVQVLIDDPRRQVIEPLFDWIREKAVKPLYDTPLMQNGGAVRGWFLPAGSPELAASLQALGNLDSLIRHRLLMAVGDGNHSLATARAHWQAIRHQVPSDHPARYALVEVINLHDDGLSFEPIHRIVAGISLEDLIRSARRWFAGRPVSFIAAADPGRSESAAVAHQADAITLLDRNSCCRLVTSTPCNELPVALIQPFLDDLAGQNGLAIDYIHGTDEVKRLVADGQIGLLLPAMNKYDLFPSIARDGVLPRKTFSLGEAYEKRYYLECRRIR